MNISIPDYVSPPRKLLLAIILTFKNGTFAELWFTLMEWVLVCAGLHAIAVVSKSTLIDHLATFSGVVATFYAIHKAEEASDYLFGLVKQARLWIRLVAAIFVIAAFVGTLLVVRSALDVALASVAVVN